jgi:phosphatidylglycerophosphatase A
MVAKKGDIFPDKELRDFVDEELEKRNINEKTVGEVVYELQSKYYPGKTAEDFGKQLPKVLKKREVLEPLAIGFELDRLTQEGKLKEPIQTIIARDMGMLSTDEVLAMSITGLYGGISQAAFGNLDNNKRGVAKELDNSEGRVNTFADDLFSALVAAVCGRVGQESE